VRAHERRLPSSYCRLWLTRCPTLTLSRPAETPVPKEGARKVLLTIDLSSAVMKEALAIPQLGAIIAYHPPIFSGLKCGPGCQPIL
jgi:hypothetical protein